MGSQIKMLTLSPRPLAILLLASAVFSAHTAKVKKPYVESYWESWDAWEHYPGDFGAFLKDIPASPPGSCKGVNLINISFGDYSGGTGGHESTDEIIKEGIEAIHAKGGLVKIALGGALYSMGAYIRTPEEATKFCEKMLDTVNDIGLDGMDLDVEDGGVGAEVQVAVIKECRRLIPDFHISYTIPATVSAVEPWMSTIRQTVEELDAVNVMAYDYYWGGYNFDLDLNNLKGLGLPADKIVYGIMPGHADAASEYVSLDDAKAKADYSLKNGLAGMMTWDVNRDCKQRMNYAAGQDNLYQTGKGDGVYLDALSARLNGC